MKFIRIVIATDKIQPHFYNVLSHSHVMVF